MSVDADPSLLCHLILLHHWLVTIPSSGELPPDSCWHACTHTHTHTVYTAVLYMHLVTIVGHGCAGPEWNREKQAEELFICSSAWIRSLLLHHHPPFELPHSRRTLIFTETIKSTGFKIDIIILPRSRRCSLGNLLCCLMELMSWHTYCICVVLPKHPRHRQSPPLTVQRMEMPALFQNVIQYKSWKPELHKQSAKHHKRSNLCFNVSPWMWSHRKDECSALFWQAPPRFLTAFRE